MTNGTIPKRETYLLTKPTGHSGQIILIISNLNKHSRENIRISQVILVTCPPVMDCRSEGVSLKIAFGVPAAAQISSY